MGRLEKLKKALDAGTLDEIEWANATGWLIDALEQSQKKKGNGMKLKWDILERFRRVIRLLENLDEAIKGVQRYGGPDSESIVVRLISERDMLKGQNEALTRINQEQGRQLGILLWQKRQNLN